MAFSRPQPVPRVPTLPKGDPVASYATYLEAQQAIHLLAGHHFPVEQLTIVGTDLRMVERVTGRMSYGRSAVAGAMSGAWFGLFVGLLLSLFGGTGVYGGVAFIGVAAGAGFGLLFSVLSYSMTRGRRDFTSQSQVVAQRYAILCASESAGQARGILLRGPATAVPAPTPVAAPGALVSPTESASPPAAVAVVPASSETRPDPRWTMPDGRPRYGALAAEVAEAAPVAQVPEAETPTTPAVVAAAGAEATAVAHSPDSQPGANETNPAPDVGQKLDDPYAAP